MSISTTSSSLEMNKNRLIKISKLVVITILMYFLGYLRNFIFLTINDESSAVYYHDTRPFPPGFMSFISTMDYKHLLQLKLVLTILFAVLFFLIAFLGISMLFKEKKYRQLAAIFYGSLFFISALFVLTGILFPSFSDHAYNISRNLMHIAQSPFTILFLFMIIYYHRRTLES
jgi:hypothetical protein